MQLRTIALSGLLLMASGAHAQHSMPIFDIKRYHDDEITRQVVENNFIEYALGYRQGYAEALAMTGNLHKKEGSTTRYNAVVSCLWDKDPTVMLAQLKVDATKTPGKGVHEWVQEYYPRICSKPLAEFWIAVSHGQITKDD